MAQETYRYGGKLFQITYRYAYPEWIGAVQEVRVGRKDLLVTAATNPDVKGLLGDLRRSARLSVEDAAG